MREQSVGVDGVAKRREVRGTGYMASLDGWRALALLGVLVAHDRAFRLWSYTSQNDKAYGAYGVYVFFAISGFLITSRILEEERLCGRFDIRGFYVRRFFRIQPAAIAYLLAAGACMLSGWLDPAAANESWFTWVAALLLFTNFVYRTGNDQNLTGHFWTLAVEEHFYILLSLTMLVFKKGRAFVLALLLCSFAVVAHFSRWSQIHASRSTQFNLKTLLLGALAAVLLREEVCKRVVVEYLRPWAVFTATLVWLLGSAMVSGLRGHSREAGFAAALAIAIYFFSIVWIVATVYHPRSLTTRMLETKPFRFLGRISYSMYLWHVLVYHLWGRLGTLNTGCIGSLPWPFLRTLAERPARVTVAVVVAYLSFRYLEKPLIRVGHRLAPPATPGRAELADLPLELVQRG